MLTIDQLRNNGLGKILAIVANGPSHRIAPLDQLKNIPGVEFMTINKPDPRIWPTQYWLFTDKSQYRRHRDEWDEYRGITVTNTSMNLKRNAGISIDSVTGRGFSLDLNKGLYIARSSTYAAMQVAVWMGFDEVYIFGVDMCAVDGKLYPWGTNPDVDDATRQNRFRGEAESFDFAATYLPVDIKSKFTLCSEYNPWEFANKFNRLPCVEAVDAILQKVESNVEQ